MGSYLQQGNQTLPYTYDGIKEILDSVGIASVYTSIHSLNKGIPGYKYYYQFAKNGVITSSKKSFTIQYKRLRIKMKN